MTHLVNKIFHYYLIYLNCFKAVRDTNSSYNLEIEFAL